MRPEREAEPLDDDGDPVEVETKLLRTALRMIRNIAEAADDEPVTNDPHNAAIREGLRTLGTDARTLLAGRPDGD